jgi:hypothetical protein
LASFPAEEVDGLRARARRVGLNSMQTGLGERAVSPQWATRPAADAGSPRRKRGHECVAILRRRCGRGRETRLAAGQSHRSAERAGPRPSKQPRAATSPPLPSGRPTRHPIAAPDARESMLR